MLPKFTVVYAILLAVLASTTLAAPANTVPRDLAIDNTQGIAKDPVAACKDHKAKDSCKFISEGKLRSGHCNDKLVCSQ
ncbi:hypothetical protein K461DRAFT_273259 [Myriangium duriaei CBS 260.36]|uniref:Antifungal protein n=1 Tax=Myriangium duriaei CBS 260.36 TaxID=1168546 RepID=A0A9P4MJG7_9PEZI|nr:hypothetical protein K461DRAFT_273259 [Myriangium duriaei CBS 260.36]